MAEEIEQGDPFAKYGGKEVSATPSASDGDPFAKYGGKEVKKKAQPSVSPSTSPRLPGGGIPDLNSLTNTNAPIIAPTQQGYADSNQLQQQAATYQQAHTPQQNADMQVAQQAPTENGVIQAPPTWSQKAAYEIKSIGASLNKGIANATIAPLYYGANKLGLVDDAETSRVLNQVHNSTADTYGLDPNTLQDGGGKIHNTINQFAFMAPALITAEGTGGASFGLQTAGQAATTVNQMKENGVKFDNHSDDLFILGSGIIGTALGRGSMGKIFNSLGSAAKDNITSALTADAIKELGEKGEQVTADEISKLFLDKATTAADKVAQTGLAGLSQYAKVGAELSAANAATFGTKKLANAVSGTEPFKDTSSGDFMQSISEPFGLDQNVHGNPLTALGNMSTSQAGIFGAIGGASEGLGLLGHNPDPVIEKLQSDNSPEAVQALKQQIVEHGQAKGWTDEDIQNAQNGVDQLSATVAKLPKGLPADKVKKGVSIIQGRNELQDQLSQLQSDRQNLDPSVSDIPGQQEQLIRDKIDQANDKLRGLVTGNRATYSKGIQEEDGQFFKTVDGVKEEITPSRYDLETMEREAKKKPETALPDIPSQTDNSTELQIDSPNQSEVAEDNASKTTENNSFQKAIDAVTHGIVHSPDERFDGYSPRFDFEMDKADKDKAVSDIKVGNYETAPAKKMLDKLQEWDKNDNYPIIEGSGGHTERRQGATSQDIQDHIDAAKANKIGELSSKQIEEINKPLSELGFTHQDFIDYENQRNQASDTGATFARSKM